VPCEIRHRAAEIVRAQNTVLVQNRQEVAVCDGDKPAVIYVDTALTTPLIQKRTELLPARIRMMMEP
jgi:hypothetical protein